MKRIHKGEYGYRDSHKKTGLIRSAVVVAAIVLQVVLGRVLGGDMRTLFTVTAAVSVLPLANVASPLLAMYRYHSADRASYEKTREYADCGTFLYDLILTSKERSYPVDFCLIRPGVLVLFSPLKKEKAEDLKKLVNGHLKEIGKKPLVNIYTDEADFFRALARMTAPAEDEHTEKDTEKIAELLRSVSY